MTKNFPNHVTNCLSILESSGFEAYLVGGCVRDQMLGKTPSDWDICTNATPIQATECLNQYRVLPTGVAHGTITVLAKGFPVEITTFRTDGTYTDHRRPDNVEFTSDLRQDLSRRDFTINAMAMRQDGAVVDLFRGRDDLDGRTLRCVGDPIQRFTEDALRILRLFRFAACLEFEPTVDTLAAASQCRNGLANVSSERILSELCALICADKPGSTLKSMCDTQVLQVVIPEFSNTIAFNQQNSYHNRTVDNHTFAAVDAIESTVILRMTMLLHDIAKPHCFRLDHTGTGHFKGHAELGSDMAKIILTRLRMDKASTKRIAQLIALHDCDVVPQRIPLKKLLSTLGEETLQQLLCVKIADTIAKDPAVVKERLNSLKIAQTMVADILAERPCLSLHDLAINGKDLGVLGFSGHDIGNELRRLLELVLEESVENRKEILLENTESTRR